MKKKKRNKNLADLLKTVKYMSLSIDEKTKAIQKS